MAFFHRFTASRPKPAFVIVFAASVLIPVSGRTQDSAAPPPPTTEAPKSDSEQSSPPPAATAPSPPAQPAPGSVRVPEVVVRAGRPKRAAPAPGPRAVATRRAPVVTAAPAPTPPLPASSPGAAALTAEAQGGPGALPKLPGQTITTVSGERIKNEPAFTIQDLLQESPGVSFKQGNGPRDLGISIRGSNARNGFGVRNIVVLEDGFPVTQPDGLSRTDLMDPHAYGGVDVYRGPSSAMFGNYATGGAINFRLWRGGEINGARLWA